MKKYFLYCLYVITVTSFFAYYLFPSDEVKKYITFKLNNANPDYDITIGHIKPAFPPGLKFHDVNFFNKGDSVIRSEWLKISPDLLTIFRKEKTFSFRSRTGEGDLGGTFRLSDESVRQIVTDMELSGIHVENLGIIQSPDYKISGIVSGNVKYDTAGSDEMLNAKLSISDCNIELIKSLSKLGILSSVIKPGPFAFNSVNTDISMSADRKIEIRQFDAKGPQINGNVSGSITLKTPSDRSVLNIEANLRPHPPFIAALGKGASLILKKKSGKEGFAFKIRGTFGRPRPSF